MIQEIWVNYKTQRMNYLKPILGVLLLAPSISTFSQWTLETAPAGKSVQNFNFISDQIGYSHVTDNTTPHVYKTTDSGSSWGEVDLPPVSFSYEFNDYHFYENGKGVVVLTESNSSDPNPTKIFQTIDDGMNWLDITPDTTTSIGWGADVHFANDQVGYLGIHDKLLMTKDGGQTWSSYDPNAGVGNFTGYAIQDVHFFDEDNGVMGFWDQSFAYTGAMYVTSDGGATWNQSFHTKWGTVTGRVIQASQNVSYTAPVKWGSQGHLEIYKTSDSGATWDTLPVPDTIANSKLIDFDFLNENYGVILLEQNWGQDGYSLYSTFDGANSWHYCGLVSDVGVIDLEITTTTGFLTSDSLGSMYQLTTGYGSLSIDESSIKNTDVYPNPVSSGGTLKVRNNNSIDQVRIYSIAGQLVYSSSNIGAVLHLPQLPSGIYAVNLTQAGILSSTKLVVQ